MSEQISDVGESPLNAQGPITSVNSRGNQLKPGAGKIIFVVLVIAVVILAGVFTFNHFRSKGKAEKALVAAAEKEEKRQEQAVTMVKARTFDEDTAGLPPASTSFGSSTPGQAVPISGSVPPVVPGGMQPTYGGQPYPSAQQAGGQPAARSRFDGDVMVSGGGVGGSQQALMSQLPPPPPGLDLLRAALGQQTGAASSAVSGGAASAGGGVLGASLNATSTPKVAASMLGNRNFVLAKGKTIDCALSMRVISALAGLATCVVSRDVFSDNGRVILIERGSEATGEWGTTTQQGQRRLAVLWTRIRTPTGVVININSPGGDELGTAGISGYVDNRWGERLGAAFLLSLVQDAIGFATAKESGGQGLAVLGNTTDNTKSMAEKVLESTINIKPTIYANQGDRAVILVARDLDFGSVYGLSLK